MRVRRVRRATVGVALAGFALLIAPGLAGASKSPRVIVTPKPGQVINTHPVRMLVNAGPEYGDLSARLNGVQVGEHFERLSRNRRALRASNSHGLRHGKNVLRVTAWRKGKLRRATVRFTVGHTRHMAGAGRDRPIPAGMRVKLRGQVRVHPSRDFGGRVRWRVVKAPRGSKLRRGPTARRAVSERAALRSRTTLTPAFKPDVLGTYKLEMQAGLGPNATTDRLTVSAGPQQPLVPISTAVPPDASDPRWGIKLSCPDPCGTPGVGSGVLRAPWMLKRSEGSNYSGSAGGGKYTALWQVVSLERSTLKVNWNRTYGWCTPGPPTTPFGGFCRRKGGEPAFVDAADELTEGGDDSLIVGSSHPSLTSLPNGSGDWGAPDTGGFVADDPLPRIGAPEDDRFTAEIQAAAPGTASIIGVPGMQHGDAQVAVIGDGRGINGYLTPDQHAPTSNYGFIPSARLEFDTRAPSGCPACVTHRIGDATHQSPNVENGLGGYLVTASDPKTLGLVDSQFFRTMDSATGPSAALDMTSYLKQRNAAGSLIMITSLKTPAIDPSLSLVHPNDSTKSWDALADQIVALGGSRHRFLLSAITHEADYSLVGWSDAEEGDGLESIAPNATLRGTLVPDGQYRYRPINTTDDGTQPANRLADLIAMPPSSNWPQYDTDPAGGDKALKWLAAQFPTYFGTADPRVAYWAAPIDVHDADKIQGDLTQLYNKPTDYPVGQEFSADAFEWAVDELYKELGWVDTARTYMTGAEDTHGVQTTGGLALPTFAAGQKAWQEANDASVALLTDLKHLEDKTELQANYFDILEGIADVVLAGAGLGGLKKLEAFVEASAGLVEEAGVLYEKNWDGGSAADDIAVEADQLGGQLQTSLQSTTAMFSQLATIVVSDPVKLAEVGTWGGCKASVGGCGLVRLDTGEQEFEEYAGPEGTKEDLQTMVDTVNRGVERTIWEELVPLAFPVWDIAAYDQSLNTDKFTNAASEDAIDLDNFSCNLGVDFGLNDPFTGAPRQAWTGSLQHITPNPSEPEQWRVRISVARASGGVYDWLATDRLKKMFGPIGSGGLGIDPHDWMRDAKPVYTPASDVLCGWKE